MGDALELKAPTLLVAMPQISDPFFQRSVVLLVAHEDEGSLGFVINRRTDTPIREILDGMSLPWHGDPEVRANFGGPVQPELGSVLYDPAEVEHLDLDRAGEIVPGVAITQHAADLAKLAEGPPASLRLVLGYAGWNAGQLVDELERHDWIIAPANPELIFGQESLATWRKALASVGIDAETLPQWTAGASGSVAN